MAQLNVPCHKFLIKTNTSLLFSLFTVKMESLLVKKGIESPVQTIFAAKKSLKSLKLSKDDVSLCSENESETNAEDILDFLLDQKEQRHFNEMEFEEGMNLISFDVEGKLIDLDDDDKTDENDLCIEKAFQDICKFNANHSAIQKLSLLDDEKEFGGHCAPEISSSQSSTVETCAVQDNELSTFLPSSAKPNNSVDSSIEKNITKDLNCDLIDIFGNFNANSVDGTVSTTDLDNQETNLCDNTIEKSIFRINSSNQCQSVVNEENLSHEKSCSHECLANNFISNCDCNQINREISDNKICESDSICCKIKNTNNQEHELNFFNKKYCHCNNHQQNFHHLEHFHHCHRNCHEHCCDKEQICNLTEFRHTKFSTCPNFNIKCASKTNECSDSNNNSESVSNQNPKDLSIVSGAEDKNFPLLEENEKREKSDDENHGKSKCNDYLLNDFSFLSKNTSQRVLPPSWLNSSSSREDCFEASQRLKRLEERFKGFSYTKKLLRDSKKYSKSEEILSVSEKEDKANDNTLTLPFTFHTKSKSKSENCLQNSQFEQDGDDDIVVGEEKHDQQDFYKRFSLLKEIPGDKECSISPNPSLNRKSSPDSSESEEICKIFNSNKNENDSNEPKYSATGLDTNYSFIFYEDDDDTNCNETSIDNNPVTSEIHKVKEEDFPIVRDSEDSAIINASQNLLDLNDNSFSSCEFDATTFNNFIKDLNQENDSVKCISGEELINEDEEIKSDGSEFYCDCLIEAVPLYHQDFVTMRETNGPLRGLLKKPNSSRAQVRKNRVVFDETRNEFFEADYIILIREDCPYEEDECGEPCTCSNELVRICCDEGCNCVTPPVSSFT